MKRARKALLLLLPTLALAVPAALLVLARASRSPVPVGLTEGRLRPCPPRPNCVCSEDVGEAAIAPFAVVGDPAAAFAELVELVGRTDGLELVAREPAYAHLVARTPLLGFRDDLELRLAPAEGVVHVRSASRVGHSDLGANRARVEELRVRWRAAR